MLNRYRLKNRPTWEVDLNDLCYNLILYLQLDFSIMDISYSAISDKKTTIIIANKRREQSEVWAYQIFVWCVCRQDPKSKSVCFHASTFGLSLTYSSSKFSAKWRQLWCKGMRHGHSTVSSQWKRSTDWNDICLANHCVRVCELLWVSAPQTNAASRKLIFPFIAKCTMLLMSKTP